MKFAVLALVSLLSAGVFADQRVDSLQDDVIGSLSAMKSSYRTQYAPTNWKKSYAGYDLQAEYDKAVAAVRADTDFTLQDARSVVVGFVSAMRDYHVSVSFLATEAATLPFLVKGAGGRYFLAYIDRNKLPEASFPFQVGDELVSFGGKSAAEAVAAVQAEGGVTNVTGTDRALAELKLTSRRAARGYAVPRGAISVGIQPKGSATVLFRQLVWDYTPERINPRGDLSHGNRISSAPKSRFGFMNAMMSADVSDLSAFDSANPHEIGAKKTYTPALGKKEWESADRSIFHSYIYRAEDGRMVGYIRIPGYIVEDYSAAVAEFAATIGYFQTNTQAMVIDQVNNPGGSVFYLYALASMLSNQPLKTPLHRMSISQREVTEALEIVDALAQVKTDVEAKMAFGPNVSGYPVTYEFARFVLEYGRFIVSEWNAGRKLTHPYWLFGVDHINPATVTYTKPILILTNALDFSGGDFFPAIMQDNNRVTILGTRTAGAGGYVEEATFPNNIGLDKFRCTGSLAERVSSNPIENLGVTPDIVYDLTPADLQGGYTGYVGAIHKAVAELK